MANTEKLKGISLDITLETREFKNSLSELRRQVVLAKNDVETLKNVLEDNQGDPKALQDYMKAVDNLDNKLKEFKANAKATFDNLLGSNVPYKSEKLAAVNKELKSADGYFSKAATSAREYGNQVAFSQGNLTHLAPILKTISNRVEENEIGMIEWKGAIHHAMNEFEEGLDYLDTDLDYFGDTEYRVDGITRQFVNDIIDADEAMLDAADGAWKTGGAVDDVGESLEEGSESANVFGDTLKAILTSDIIKGGLNLLKEGLEAIWDGIKTVAKGYADLMKQGIEYNASIQGYETTLSAVLGDRGQAEKLVKNLRQVGVQFGYDTSALLEMSSLLIASGENADDTEKSISSIVSVLSLFGKGNAELKRVSQNLLQIKQRGNAAGKDLQEFANNGIPIMQMLSDLGGKFAGDFEVTDVKYEDIINAIQNAVNQVDSIYAKSGEIRQSTYTGQMDKLEANWQVLWGNLAETTSQTLTSEVLPAINEFISDVNTAFEEGGYEAAILTFKENLGPTLQKVLDSGIITDFLEAATIIAEAFANAFDDSEEGQKNRQLLSEAIESFLKVITNFIKDNRHLFVQAGQEIGEAIKQGFDESLGPAKDFILEASNMNNPSNIWDVIFGSSGFGALQSGGFRSGGFSNQITLNASFVANGNLDEAQALRFADIISERVNEQLGQMI